MNIMVFDVPADSGGALSILRDFYNEVQTSNNKGVNWFFVLSTPELEETFNIKVLRFPWIKKSWGHRLYFDHIMAPNLVKKYKIDKVISFQNVVVPHIKVPQVLYVHQSLPFIEHRFSFKTDRLFWIYQNIIGKMIKRSISRAQQVVVQTDWMKEELVKSTKAQEKNIGVVPPKISVKPQGYFQPTEESLKTFFYPAGAHSYKNHKVIVEACQLLKKSGHKEYRVILTVQGHENPYIEGLYQEVKDNRLPIEFRGSMQRDEVFELYTKSTLLFPSFVETFGLPMLEAKIHQGMIIASDCPFSHEILDNYANAYFFQPFDAERLAELMVKNMEQINKYTAIVAKAEKPEELKGILKRLILEDF